MQIPDHRIKKIAKLMSNLQKWNEYHPSAPLPCGFVEQIEEDLKYLEERMK